MLLECASQSGVRSPNMSSHLGLFVAMFKKEMVHHKVSVLALEVFPLLSLSFSRYFRSRI